MSPEDTKRIQKVCLDVADERRLIIALIADTGMRLSEALGLVWNEKNIQHQYTPIRLVLYSRRLLKTAN